MQSSCLFCVIHEKQDPFIIDINWYTNRKAVARITPGNNTLLGICAAVRNWQYLYIGIWKGCLRPATAATWMMDTLHFFSQPRVKCQLPKVIVMGFHHKQNEDAVAQVRHFGRSFPPSCPSTMILIATKRDMIWMIGKMPSHPVLMPEMSVFLGGAAGG